MKETLTIGEKRLEYLDFANKAYSGNEFDTAQRYMDNFLMTIRDSSQISDEVKNEFDNTEKKKEETWKKLVMETKDHDTQMQCEERFYGWQDINIQMLKERLNICWQIASKYKLFSITSD